MSLQTFYALAELILHATWRGTKNSFTAITIVAYYWFLRLVLHQAIVYIPILYHNGEWFSIAGQKMSRVIGLSSWTTWRCACSLLSLTKIWMPLFVHKICHKRVTNLALSRSRAKAPSFLLKNKISDSNLPKTYWPNCLHCQMENFRPCQEHVFSYAIKFNNMPTKTWFHDVTSVMSNITFLICFDNSSNSKV